MIQLKVYDSPAKETQYWIDLYETEPIKLTLSIEDITNADATSTFSRAFKVPGTRNNAEFFKNAFDIDGTLFDVTVKKPAEILVDGAEFKQGHVRLQKIFTNIEQDRYDYELLFLGETRDFSSLIGDKGLCELAMPDLVGGNGAQGAFVVSDIVTSWKAFPQAFDPTTGAAITPSLTNGLHDGNIIYPLIDHGNTYDSAGNVLEARISLVDTDRFTQGPASNPLKSLTLNRFKPMIRARRILEQIFADVGYTWTSDFLDSELFQQIYISAFGNNATVGWDAGASSPNSDNVCYAEAISSDLEGQVLFNNVNDPGGNLSVLTSTPYGPMTVYELDPGATGDYVIQAQCYYSAFQDNSNGYPSPVSGELLLYNMSVSPPQLIDSSNIGSGYGSTLQISTTINVPNDIAAGSKIGLVVLPSTGVNQSSVTNTRFRVVSAPGRFNPVSSLECTYKQIDFVKDILTAFRLVLSPDPNNPQNFIIEPWQTYINSGELYDWSKKLVESKEIVSEPVFFSQSDVIDFKFQNGSDYENIYHQQAYNEPYGWLQFSSNNDLLKGEREIKLTGIAPTPISRIEGAGALETFILPQLHTHSSEDNGLQHKPIKPKTRMLFYNGCQSVGGNANHWYLQGTTGNTANGDWSIYPLVSPYQEWPIQSNTLNLNWANDVQYWGAIPNYNNVGSTLYSDYWSRYISSLYNKYSRRVTAYFVLNNIDLNTFSFDDTIFVNGTYYRPEKIIDVEIGDYTEVQVQLLTANDFKPPVIINQDLAVLSVTPYGPVCAGQTGGILVVTNGTPGFTWTLSNGMTGVGNAGAPPDSGPYQFDIVNVAPGTYTLDIVDSLGRPYSTQVTVPAGYASLPTASQHVQAATACNAPCNGQITVTPSGGTGTGYTIYWYDNPLLETTFTRTDLCPGQYSYYIMDSNGCMSPSYLAVVECEAAGGTVWNYAKDLNCEALSSQFYKVFVPTGTTPQPGIDYVSLGAYEVAPPEGCFTPVMETTGTPDYYIDLVYLNCEACQGGPTPTSIRCEPCPGNTYQYPRYIWAGNTWAFGQVIKDSTPGYNDCFTVVDFEYTEVPNLYFNEAFDTCEECLGGQVGTNLLIEDCSTAEAYVLPNTYNMLVGQTVQYVRDSEPGTVYCGTIYSTTSTLPTDGTLYSGREVSCDSKFCNFSPAPTEYYIVEECGAPYFWTAEKGSYNFVIGDVIQFRFLPDIALYCGTITNIVTDGIPDILITKPYPIPGCDDTLHCFQ